VVQIANLSFRNKFLYISVVHEASDFKFGISWGLPSPIVKSRQKKKWVWPWASRVSQNFGGSLLIFLQRLKLATSNLEYSLGLLRPIIKRISGCGLGLGELPKILGLPYNIPANAEASERKFGVQLGFVKNYHKIIRRRKMGRGPGLRFPFAKAHHKITRRGKSVYDIGLKKLPKFWGSTVIFLQRLKLATSNLVA